MARKKSAGGNQAGDVIRGVLETFYPDGSGAAAARTTVAPRARGSDPGQDPYTLAVVQTDYVATVAPPKKGASKKEPGQPYSPWAEQTKKNLLAALRDAKAEAKGGAQRDAIQEAIAHIESRWR